MGEEEGSESEEDELKPRGMASCFEHLFLNLDLHLEVHLLVCSLSCLVRQFSAPVRYKINAYIRHYHKQYELLACCFVGLTGMKNIGNSCYMNAALQALSNWWVVVRNPFVICFFLFSFVNPKKMTKWHFILFFALFFFCSITRANWKWKERMICRILANHGGDFILFIPFFFFLIPFVSEQSSSHSVLPGLRRAGSHRQEAGSLQELPETHLRAVA